MALFLQSKTLRKMYHSVTLAPVLIVCLASLIMVSCGGIRDGAPKHYSKQWDEIPDAIPVDVSPSKYGNPDNYEVMGKTYYVRDVPADFEQSGIASWYGTKFHGRRTSSGDEYDMYLMTAAHKTLRIPVFVEVTNVDNGRKAIVKVNDRGPFHEGRIIDLSYAAATKLGVAQSGTANVKIRLIGVSDKAKTPVSNVVKNAVVLGPVGEPKSAVASSDKLYVQVAVFSTRKNALTQMARLQEQGFFDVRLHVEQKKDSALYRVRIGPLPSERVAKNVSAQLEENNHHDLKIVRSF